MTSAFKNVTNEKVRELKIAVQNLNTDKKGAVSISRFFFLIFPLVTITFNIPMRARKTNRRANW